MDVLSSTERIRVNLIFTMLLISQLKTVIDLAKIYSDCILFLLKLKLVAAYHSVLVTITKESDAV